MGVFSDEAAQFERPTLPSPKHHGKSGLLIRILLLLTPLVQEANWYKPEPGEPYRPLIAMPSQLKERIPWFSFCSDIFTAYDPPTALRSAPALAPVITPGSDAKTQNLVAVPRPTMDLGAKKTAAAGKKSDSVPMVAPAAQKTPSPSTHLYPEKSSSDPKQGSDIGQSGDISEDPRQQVDPNVPGLPLQKAAAVDSNQDPNQNSNPDAHNEPKQSDNEDPTGRVSGQKDPGASLVTDPEATTPADNSNDPSSGSKASAQVVSINQVLQPFPHGVSIVGTTLTPEVPTLQVPQRILTTIAGHAITAAPTALAIAGTTMNPGDSGVTIGGTLVALNNPGNLILNSKTIPFASGLPKPITTTIAGQAVTADPTAVAMAGTTLRPGDPVITVDGTSVALDAAGRFLIGSKTIPFGTESAKPLVTTIAGQTITAAASAIVIADTTLRPGDAGSPINGTTISLDMAGHFVVGSKTHTFGRESVGVGEVSGTAGPVTAIMPSVTQSNLPTGMENVTRTSVQIFNGEAEDLKSNLLWMKAVVVMIAIAVLIQA